MPWAPHLRYRNRTGRGQWIDIAMYQAGVMFLSEYLMDATINGREGGRMGNRHPHRAPQGCYPALGKDQWITLSVGSDEEWQALCELMGQPELADDPRFADILSRHANHDEADEVISRWTATTNKYALMHQLQGVGIPAGPVLTGRDIHFDPHYRHRGFLERVDFAEEREVGSRFLMGRPYKFSNTPMSIRGPGPMFGQNNEDLLKELLALDEATYQGLLDDTIITTTPASGDPSPQMEPSRAVELGLLADYDPDYLQRLGLA